MNDLLYYDQDSIWRSKNEDYQTQVIYDILEMIPQDTQSILDVGCGDGKITNILPKDINVVGLDISESALKHVVREKVIGSLEKLPFDNKSFDLVMANDVIEHLPDDIYCKALDEIARVAKKYILITVPNNEQYESNLTKCAKCGKVYHINWHQRVYDINTIKSLNLQKEWKPIEIRYSGSLSNIPYDPTILMRHRLECYRVWDSAICPTCGSNDYVKNGKEFDLLKLLDAYKHTESFKKDSIKFNNRSEIIGLYSFDRLSENFNVDRGPFEERKESLFKIEFSNPLQTNKDGLMKSSFWSQFFVPSEAEVDENGIHVKENYKFAEIPIRFPSIPQIGDRVSIKASGNSTNDELYIYSYDSVSEVYRLVGNSNVEGNNTDVIFPIDYTWTADSYGLPFLLTIYGDTVIHSIEYNHQIEKEDKNTVFIKLHAGHNVYTQNKDGIVYSWGLLCTAAGNYPKPELFMINKDLTSNQNWQDEIILGLTNECKRSISFLKGQIYNQNILLEKGEMKRSKAEDSFSSALETINSKDIEIVRLNTLANSIENLRSKTEASYSSALETINSKDIEIVRLNELANNIERLRSKTEDFYSTALKTINSKNREIEKYELAKRNRNWRILIISCGEVTKDGKDDLLTLSAKALSEHEKLNVRIAYCKNSAKNKEKNSSEWVSVNGVLTKRMSLSRTTALTDFLFKRNTLDHLALFYSIWNDFKFDIVQSSGHIDDLIISVEVAKWFKLPSVVMLENDIIHELKSKTAISSALRNAICDSSKIWVSRESEIDQIADISLKREISKKLDAFEFYNKGIFGSENDERKWSEIVCEKYQDI